MCNHRVRFKKRTHKRKVASFFTKQAAFFPLFSTFT